MAFVETKEDFLVFYPITLLVINPTGASSTDGDKHERGTFISTVIPFETKWKRWLHKVKPHSQQ